MQDKTRHRWLPPQRHPRESTRHYVAALSRQMRALKLVYEDDHNGHDLRQKCRNRYDKCLELRDEAEVGHK